MTWFVTRDCRLTVSDGSRCHFPIARELLLLIWKDHVHPSHSDFGSTGQKEKSSLNWALLPPLRSPYDLSGSAHWQRWRSGWRRGREIRDNIPSWRRSNAYRYTEVGKLNS